MVLKNSIMIADLIIEDVENDTNPQVPSFLTNIQRVFFEFLNIDKKEVSYLEYLSYIDSLQYIGKIDLAIQYRLNGYHNSLKKTPVVVHTLEVRDFSLFLYMKENLSFSDYKHWRALFYL